jgi:mannose-6-phosphate isomerase
MPIIKKPWGHEELLEHNAAYVLKRLFMCQGHRCSLQYHNKKKETVYILSGKLKIVHGSDADKLQETVFQAGDFLTIPPGMVHRMEAIEDCFYLESSTPELNDVVRLKDDYKRAE